MEHLPDSNSRYKDVDYWDERYKHEESFEWFGNFYNFKHLLELHVGKEDRILVLDLTEGSVLNSSLPPGEYLSQSLQYWKEREESVVLEREREESVVLERSRQRNEREGVRRESAVLEREESAVLERERERESGESAVLERAESLQY
ncbi:Endothelin-converting enzyme 2 [Acipenser ruthenus]|uniref:Endothelin-converting enzyme 2 n=1 Tax=Acipenser ruthenus TaxID=7906 RepID=A0A662YT45_ACIRT|nr:Endothelin-converting enzyme 2 [Acipenser ruthenus]